MQRAIRALIDTGGNCVIISVPGGFEIKLSPGSRVIRCEDAVSGHMMVPVSDFENESMRSEKKWILYGPPGNNDGNKSGEASPIQISAHPAPRRTCIPTWSAGTPPASDFIFKELG